MKTHQRMQRIAIDKCSATAPVSTLRSCKASCAFCLGDLDLKASTVLQAIRSMYSRKQNTKFCQSIHSSIFRNRKKISPNLLYLYVYKTMQRQQIQPYQRSRQVACWIKSMAVFTFLYTSILDELPFSHLKEIAFLDPPSDPHDLRRSLHRQLLWQSSQCPVSNFELFQRFP